jgi:hypothetical protein
VRRVGPGGPGRDGLHRGDRLASQPGRVEGSGPRPRGLHPLLVEEDGSARQEALGGGVHVFPQSFFLTGSLAGLPVPCVSVSAQRLFHTGYESRGIDRHDLAVLDELDRSDSDAVAKGP